MSHRFLDQLFSDFHCAFSANVVEYLIPTEEIDYDESVRGYYSSDASINCSCFQNVVVALFSVANSILSMKCKQESVIPYQKEGITGMPLVYGRKQTNQKDPAPCNGCHAPQNLGTDHERDNRPLKPNFAVN